MMTELLTSKPGQYKNSRHFLCLSYFHSWNDFICSKPSSTDCSHLMCLLCLSYMTCPKEWIDHALCRHSYIAKSLCPAAMPLALTKQFEGCHFNMESTKHDNKKLTWWLKWIGTEFKGNRLIGLIHIWRIAHNGAPLTVASLMSLLLNVVCHRERSLVPGGY